MAAQATQELRDAVYRRAGGKCECTMQTCSHHTGRCNAMLRGAWEIHRITAGGAYTHEQREGNVPNLPPQHT